MHIGENYTPQAVRMYKSLAGCKGMIRLATGRFFIFLSMKGRIIRRINDYLAVCKSSRLFMSFRAVAVEDILCPIELIATSEFPVLEAK